MRDVREGASWGPRASASQRERKEDRVASVRVTPTCYQYLRKLSLSFLTTTTCLSRSLFLAPPRPLAPLSIYLYSFLIRVACLSGRVCVREPATGPRAAERFAPALFARSYFHKELL